MVGGDLFFRTGEDRGGGVTYFTVASHQLPRDMVFHVACDISGRVWFSSSAHLLGGVGCYEGAPPYFHPRKRAPPR